MYTSGGSSGQPRTKDYTGYQYTGEQSSGGIQRPHSAGATKRHSSSSSGNNNVYTTTQGTGTGIYMGSTNYSGLGQAANPNIKTSNLSNGYARNNGTSNIHFGVTGSTNPNSALLGQAFPGQRPSSAGHSRPSSQNISGQVQASMQAQNLPNPNGSGQTYSRPKSAGAVRRSDSSAPSTSAIHIPSLNQSTQKVQIQYQQGSQGQLPQAGQRPMSANATNVSGTFNDHWSTSYKLHYGYAGVGVPSTTDSRSTTQQRPPEQSQAPPSTASRPISTTVNRIRSAVDQSHKTTTEDGEEVALGVDTDINGEKKLLAREDDDEMDGKPIGDSRSHPEISTTTPSQSIELGNSHIDIRNTSIDSLQEEPIDVGISTVPNQFCSAREALDLRKLILMNNNSRGGIVPSSTAVMDMYMVGKVVGVGSYGKVRAAWHRLTGAKVAIKTYDKSKLKDPAHWKRVHSEIKIMEQVSHPRIARMYEAVETPKRMHLIMECLDGGNLCSYVKQKRRLSEEESKRIFFQVLQSIEFLHAQGVSHRDVKLENVLFADSKDVKLIDFGFSTICQPGKRLKVFCGTPSYMAPEIVRRMEYEGKPVDVWSLGILLYALLCGCFPFRAKSYPDLYRKIARGTFNIPEELSMPVRDLLRQLLTVDANQRITAYSAMRHPWLHTQLSSSPDMDKLRLEIPILISDRAADDVDDEVVAELERFGIARDETMRTVLSKTHSSMGTFYYLLLDVSINRRKTMGGAKRATSSMSSYKSSSNRPLSAYIRPSHERQSHEQGHSQQQQHTQQQQIQHLILNKDGNGTQEYSRPKSASATRPSNGQQRPLSAFAGRR